MEIPEPIRHTLVTLLREMIDGPPGQAAFVLNVGDRGLLRSLAKLRGNLRSEAQAWI